MKQRRVEQKALAAERLEAILRNFPTPDTDEAVDEHVAQFQVLDSYLHEVDAGLISELPTAEELGFACAVIASSVTIDRAEWYPFVLDCLTQGAPVALVSDDTRALVKRIRDTHDREIERLMAEEVAIEEHRRTWVDLF